jgi:hypothetical protein
VHANELEENSSWNPSYQATSKTEEIPSPLYQVQDEEDSSENLNDQGTSNWLMIFALLKRDVFPILFLMAGSVFFLFGLILFLFSKDGMLTLQWASHNSLYFLVLSIPLIFFGWNFLHQFDEKI